MRAWQRISAFCLMAFCLGAGACAFAEAPNPVPPLDTILLRMAQARAENQTRLRPYKVTRAYRLFGQATQVTRSEVIADVTFVPPDVKHYEIRQANGLGLGESIVRQMLDHETDIVKNNGANDLTAANYDFRFVREEERNGRRVYVLEILPRRKDKTLLRGHVWVDATTYRLHRTEGKPGKAPSWWLRDSSIVLVYGDVEGMWLQTSSESTASVRLLGAYSMQSRDLEYKVGNLPADARMLIPQ